MFMWLRPFRWRDITALCSAEGDEDILVDGGTCGKVRSETIKNRLSCQRDDGFVSVEPSGMRYGAFWGSRGTIACALAGSKSPDMARPPHDSGCIQEIGLCLPRIAS
jgi:hypothetical protein